MFKPFRHMLGGYSQNDGTIDFYGRINSILSPDMTLLDIGAGRGAWYEDDEIFYRKSVRLMRGKVNRVIAVDVDESVLQNRSADECIVMKGGTIPIDDQSMDIIVADYVLEHIDDTEIFVSEINRVLKPGGWFCARTPHKYFYGSIFARLVSNKKHSSALRRIQPDRKECDIFQTAYKINTISEIETLFKRYENKSFIYRIDPPYFFNLASLFHILSLLHRFMPAPLCGNLFVFLQKL